MKKQAKRLQLAKETLRTLERGDVRRAAGALWPSEPGAHVTCTCNTSYDPCGYTADASCALSCASYFEC